MKDWKFVAKRPLMVPFIALVVGIALLILSLIPITTVEEVYDRSFTVDPGIIYGPQLIEHHYLYRNLSKTVDNYLYVWAIRHQDPPWLTRSVVRGEVSVEGESINIYVGSVTSYLGERLTPEEPYIFLDDPAHSHYLFIFNSTEGTSEASVRIRLEEIWTGPIALSSGSHLLGGITGILMSLAGSLQLVIRRFTPKYDQE